MSTITAPFYGCIDLKELHGPLIITVHDAESQRHKAGAWMTDEPGCGKTTDHQRHLEIDGGSENLLSPSYGEVINIEFDYVKQWASQTYMGKPCGGAQFDTTNAVTGEMAAIYIFTKIRCRDEKPDTPVITRPPIIIVPDHPPYVPPEVPMTPVPEPSSILLLGSILARAVWMKWR